MPLSLVKIGHKRSLVGNRSALGGLSVGKWSLTVSFSGNRKYYLLSHQPESGRCGLQVILLDIEKREKSENKPTSPPETAHGNGRSGVVHSFAFGLYL